MQDLHRFRIFLKIAETGSISEASRKLDITQPSLTRQVKLLENQVGAELFVRQRRGMTLTQAGRDLRHSIGPSLQDLDAAFERIHSFSSHPSGHVRLGVVSTLTHNITAGFARRIAADCPGLSLTMCEGFSAHLIEWLHRGELDFAIVCGSSVGLHMPADDLLVEELVLLGSKDQPPPADTVPFDHLPALPLILPSSPNDLRKRVDAVAAKRGVRLCVRYEANSLTVTKALVRAGLGYGIMPISALEPGEDWVYAQIRQPKLTKQLVLAGLRLEDPAPATKAVRTLVVDEVTRLLRTGQLAGAHAMFGPGVRRGRGEGLQTPPKPGRLNHAPA